MVGKYGNDTHSITKAEIYQLHFTESFLEWFAEPRLQHHKIVKFQIPIENIFCLLD